MWIFVYICIIKANNNHTDEPVEQDDACAAPTNQPVDEADAGAAATPAPATDISTEQPIYSPVTSVESLTSPLSPPSVLMCDALMHNQKGVKYYPLAKPTTATSAVPIINNCKTFMPPPPAQFAKTPLGEADQDDAGGMGNETG